MPRIVDVEQVFCAECEYKGKCGPMIQRKELLCDVPSMPTIDAVPVVRCGECKRCDPETMHCDHPMGTALPLPRKPDDFCSYGERKDGAEDG